MSEEAEVRRALETLKLALFEALFEACVYCLLGVTAAYLAIFWLALLAWQAGA